MALQSILDLATQNVFPVLGISVTILCIHLVVTWVRLRNIPGPLLAKLSNLPRLQWVWMRRAHETHIKLHEKYGKLVRFGPSMVSVGDATEVKNIYRMNAPLVKVSAV